MLIEQHVDRSPRNSVSGGSEAALSAELEVAPPPRCLSPHERTMSAPWLSARGLASCEVVVGGHWQ